MALLFNDIRNFLIMKNVSKREIENVLNCFEYFYETGKLLMFNNHIKIKYMKNYDCFDFADNCNKMQSETNGKNLTIKCYDNNKYICKFVIV